ncbi:hypothetical protein [uncultured Amnibacterium sp.]|uniref:hypothetical protein n=1 Tax=uncultured Amnibacterium sp. TaxID=1631851 RepID=UPI0035CA710C
MLNDVVRLLAVLRGRTLFTFSGADGRLPLTTAPQFLQAELRSGSRGTLADASIGLRTALALPTIIEIVVIVLAAVVLFGIVRRIAIAAAFAQPVLRRWRLLAIILTGGGVLQGLTDTVVGRFIWANVTGDASDQAKAAFLGGDYSGIGLALPNWPVPLILVGVVAGSLAIAFRSGADLERQTVGVI